MDMDVKKRDSFMEMMNGVAKTHGCMIKFDLTPKDIHLMGITIQKQGWIQVFDIDWRKAKSQTEAATTVWAKFFSDFHENPVDDYIKCDVEMTKAIGRYTNMQMATTIKDVIFNDPATIVFWADGTKTVVKCQEGDEFDPEKGLTMAIAKKVYGNKGSYCNVIKKWCEPYHEKQYERYATKINEALELLRNLPTVKFHFTSEKSDA